MRYECQLVGIYNRWLSRPENNNVPLQSADEALFEVTIQRRDMMCREDLPEVTKQRAVSRMNQQEIWLHRFIDAWRYFERQA